MSKQATLRNLRDRLAPHTSAPPQTNVKQPFSGRSRFRAAPRNPTLARFLQRVTRARADAGINTLTFQVMGVIIPAEGEG